MFGAGRYSIPRPVTRNLEDLDSVQSVLLHRSVAGTGRRLRQRPGRGDRWRGPQGRCDSPALRRVSPRQPFVVEAGSEKGRRCLSSPSPGRGGCAHYHGGRGGRAAGAGVGPGLTGREGAAARGPSTCPRGSPSSFRSGGPAGEGSSPDALLKGVPQPVRDCTGAQGLRLGFPHVEENGLTEGNAVASIP